MPVPPLQIRADHFIVGADAAPRFELFHAASSLCSQKVRTVLAEKRLPYRSNDMMILSSMGPEGVVAAEHYHPPYVRLRLIAGQWGRTGRSSAATAGALRSRPKASIRAWCRCWWTTRPAG